MSYNTILVHCDGAKATAGRLDIAVGLAKKFKSHLVGLHVRPPFEVPAFIDTSFASEALFEAFENSVAADAEAARKSYDNATAGKDVAKEWRSADGRIDDEVVVHARYSDLVVVGQTAPDGGALTPTDLPETVALASGRPTLVVPYVGAKSAPGKVVLLCWNASKEAARAASEALPLLKGAEKVVVLAIDARRSNDGHGAEPGADVANWLARHGVNVTVQRDVAVEGDVGATILSRAADYGADLIVMGVYGHSRAREFIMGGASRTILASMTVPVLMAH